VTLNENLYGERSPPIRFEEISSGSQINEFGIEMRYPQPQRTATVMLELHQEGVLVAVTPKELGRFSEDLGKNVKMKWSPVLLPGQDAGSPAPTPITKLVTDAEFPSSDSEAGAADDQSSGQDAVSPAPVGQSKPSERAEPSERARQSRPSERACDKVTRRSASFHEDCCGNCLLSDSSKAQTVRLLLSREAENTLLQNSNILRVTYADAEETSIRMLFKEVLKFFEFETGGPKLRMDLKAAKAIVPVKDRFDTLLQNSNIRRANDVDETSETKFIGGVGLDAGCIAPEGSVTKAKFMLDALVALLQPRCSEALLRPPRSEVVVAAVPSQWHEGASWLEQDFRTRVAPHLSLQNSEETTAVVEGAEG